ncbi:hypothetical protein LguiB_003112 [Lonicera macranthoides]
MKIIFMIVTITLTLTITLTTFKHTNFNNIEQEDTEEPAEKKVLMMPSKRVSRFLAGEKNPRAADHCHKDNDLCYLLDGKNSTCCNNKCVNYKYDKLNCGKCKHKCEYTETCCRGQCVDLFMDKRHCGACNTRCMSGRLCIYGMCDYA